MENVVYQSSVHSPKSRARNISRRNISICIGTARSYPDATEAPAQADGRSLLRQSRQHSEINFQTLNGHAMSKWRERQRSFSTLVQCQRCVSAPSHSHMQWLETQRNALSTLLRSNNMYSQQIWYNRYRKSTKRTLKCCAKEALRNMFCWSFLKVTIAGRRLSYFGSRFHNFFDRCESGRKMLAWTKIIYVRKWRTWRYWMNWMNLHQSWFRKAAAKTDVLSTNRNFAFLKSCVILFSPVSMSVVCESIPTIYTSICIHSRSL